MSAYPLIGAVVLLLSMSLPEFALADPSFESPKLSSGVITEGSGFQSSKGSPGVVTQGAAVQSSKFTSGVVMDNAALQSTKLSVAIIVEVLPGGGIVTRAPLTHW